jgi:DNA-binding CsgD family transcriptional regulator
MRIAIQEDPLSLCRQLGIDVVVEKVDEKVLWKREYEFLLGKIRPTFGLGEREAVCLALSFSSFSAKFVGDVLGISHRTVESHLQGCYQKMSCQNKQQCLGLVVERGMLSIFHELSLIILKMQND